MKDLREASRVIFDEPTIPGDAKDRRAFFDHQLNERADESPRLRLRGNVRIPRYDKTREMRIPVAFPEKLRENMRALLGVESDEDYSVSTTAIALADFAARYLLDQNMTLVVTQAKGANDR